MHRYFNKFNKNQKKCSFCGWVTFSNATRMLKHIKKCVKCPEDVRKVIVKTTVNQSHPERPTNQTIVEDLESDEIESTGRFCQFIKFLFLN